MDGSSDISDPYEALSHGECQDALHTLYHYLDGELTAERREVIRRHLEQCSPCLEAFDFEAELKAVVARCCRAEVPESLRRRVAEALQRADQAFGGVA